MEEDCQHWGHLFIVNVKPKTIGMEVILDMQDPNKRRKKRGKLYFSSTKALKTRRMGRKKVAIERYETSGINKVLDFEDTGENNTLSTVEETEGPSMSQGLGSQC